VLIILRKKLVPKYYWLLVRGTTADFRTELNLLKRSKEIFAAMQPQSRCFQFIYPRKFKFIESFTFI